MTDAVDRAEERVREQHADVIAAVEDAADAVASDWDGGTTTDAVADPLREELERRGLGDDLLSVLEAAVAATPHELPADPVAAPPYVVVTSRGPVLRATLPDGRLVVTIAVFAVDRDPPRYRRSEGDPLSVALRRAP